MDAGKPKQSVFVVEQEAFLAHVICRALTKAGYLARYLPTPEIALDILAEQQPDFLIVATDLRPMGGEEFCRRIQNDIAERTFPVFVMSDVAHDIHARWSQWFSNFRIVEKPISLRFIVEEMQKHAGQQPDQAA